MGEGMTFCISSIFIELLPQQVYLSPNGILTRRVTVQIEVSHRISQAQAVLGGENRPRTYQVRHFGQNKVVKNLFTPPGIHYL
jgi:hypothetical protein